MRQMIIGEVKRWVRSESRPRMIMAEKTEQVSVEVGKRVMVVKSKREGTWMLRQAAKVSRTHRGMSGHQNPSG